MRVTDTYTYPDENGHPLYKVFRTTPKGFFQHSRLPDGTWKGSMDGVRRVLYRLPQVIEAAALGKRICIVEGERDVERLEELGFVATTNSGGAGQPWRREYSEILKGARIVILPDNDDPGQRHALDAAQSLHDADCVVSIVDLPDLPKNGDVSDWLDQGGSPEELERLISESEVWVPNWDVPQPLSAPEPDVLPLNGVVDWVRKWSRTWRCPHKPRRTWGYRWPSPCSPQASAVGSW